MKSFLFALCALLALSRLGVPTARAEADPGDQFLNAYFLIQDGETAEHQSDWAAANTKYKAALEILKAIKAQHPDWYPTLLEFRRKFCEDHIAALQPKLPPTVTPAMPATSAVTEPSTEPPPPFTPADQVRQLQEELQRTKEQVRRLQETRDELRVQLEGKLKERAPIDRESARQTLEHLRALRAVYEAIKAKLEESADRYARSDALGAELKQAQERIQNLEASRTDLNTKLQAALAKTSTTETTPQVEELLKKNAELTAQLAGTQAEITKMREQLSAATTPPASAETVKLRTELGQTRTELNQVKGQLQQRSEELAVTRKQLEVVKADRDKLVRSQEEITARLTESDRQLRAARASSQKGDQIIQQLRKENAVLRQIADRKETEGSQAKGTVPQPARKAGGGGFLWFKPRANTTTNRPPAATSASEAGRLTATVQAPAPPEAARPKTGETPSGPPPEPVAAAPDTNALLRDASVAARAKDYDTATTKLQAVLIQQPNNLAALTNLGLIAYQQGKLDEAADTLRKAVAVAPNESQAHALLGVVYLRKARNDDAYSELTRAVALDPRNAEAHNYLGIVMSEKGWAAAGEQEIQRALELNPQYADAHFNLAVLYSRAKTARLELARDHYQKALDLGAAPDPQLEAALMGAAAKPGKP